MSKYKITKTPYYKPGKCANCGSSKEDRDYVDFGLEIEWYGIVYLCTLCLNDVAKAAGLFNDLIEELKVEKERNTSLDDLREKGDELHETVRHAFRSLEDFYGELSDLQSGSPDSDSSDTPSVESNPSAEDKSDSSEPITRGKTRTAQSSSSSGPQNLPSLADLINANGNSNNS